MIGRMNNGNHPVVASLKQPCNASTTTEVVTCFHLELTSALVGGREWKVSEVSACHSKSHILVILSTSQFPDFSDRVEFGLCTLNLCFRFLYISLGSILPQAAMRGPVKTCVSSLRRWLPSLSTSAFARVSQAGRTAS